MIFLLVNLIIILNEKSNLMSEDFVRFIKSPNKNTNKV
jgi:hypothetical protein